MRILFTIIWLLLAFGWGLFVIGGIRGLVYAIVISMLLIGGKWPEVRS